MPKTVKTKTSAEDQATLFNNIIDAQNNDIAVGKKSKESAKDVAAKWDLACGDINWTTIAFNKSAASNNMEEGSFKLLKKIRTAYRDGWMEDNDNFDQRWQYVKKQSKHYTAPANGETATKSPEQKACEHARGLFRQAVEMGDHELEAIARDACERLGLGIKEAE